MTNVLKNGFYLFLLLTTCTTAIAEETFELNGEVDAIDKVSQTIILNGQRMLVSGDVQTSFENRRGHLLNILTVGSSVFVSGSVGHGEVFIIDGATIHSMPPMQKQEQ